MKLTPENAQALAELMMGLTHEQAEKIRETVLGMLGRSHGEMMVEATRLAAPYSLTRRSCGWCQGGERPNCAICGGVGSVPSSEAL